MAPPDDEIEYEGIAEDRSIRVGSDRDFRDHSPGDTILSLSDDGRAIYTAPIPSFEAPTAPAPDEASSEAVHDFIPLHQDALLAAGSRRSSSGSSSGSGRTPLGRFRRDEQVYEKLALQLSAADASPGTPVKALQSDRTLSLDGKQAAIELDMISRDSYTSMPPAPHLHPRGHDIPLPPSAPQLPRTVLARSTSGSAAQALKAAADELREKQRFMRTPAWEDLSSEEQAKFMHEVFLLRRRVRALELPRESKAVRVRKRKGTLRDSNGRSTSAPTTTGERKSSQEPSG